ncbi:MAG: sensor histidine kinase [Microbacteriaceae bacterium]|nr:sensor histidine kinase [Microbacteriaceae bacterium]
MPLACRADEAGCMTTTSATLAPVIAIRPPLYAQLWRRVPRELGYLLPGYPIAMVGFCLSVALLATSFATLITFFLGVFILIATLYIARGFGTVELVRLRWSGQPPITGPEWQDARARQGFWSWLRAVVGNGHYWLALLHTLVISPVASFLSWLVTIIWTSTALGALSYGLWINAIGRGSLTVGRYYLTNWLFPNALDGTARLSVELVLNVLFGLVLLALLPFVTRGFTVMHWGIARLLLSPFRSDALKRQVIALNQSRGAAASAEGQSLRKLERDLHDGPQQRLVRLQMDIAAAQRVLDTDPTAAHGLLEGAMTQSKEALEELRALSRGFAPPLLLDRGLAAALDSLAARSTVPVTFDDRLGDAQLPLEIERNAYFVASELLANVAKHSGAKSASLAVTLRSGEQAETTWLDVTVTDDGAGGASAVAGHGLAGLDERLHGLGGTLEISSPSGGPTVVIGQLPVVLG